MKNIMTVMLALAIATLVNVAQAAPTDPSKFTSLHPFQKFAKGEGEGVAYEYKSRTKVQFIALLRDKRLAKKEMRVTCEVLVRQMVEGNKDLPFEGCEGASAAIERDENFAVVSCRDEMFQRDNWLAVTNKDGSAFGVWHRKCLSGEQVLVYKGHPIVSLTCLNVAIPVLQTAPLPPKPTVTTTITVACPDGFALVANAWSLSAMPDGLRKKAEELVGSAKGRDTSNATNPEAYKPDAVSRTIGGQLRREVKTRAAVDTHVVIQLRDPKTTAVVKELGTIRLVAGTGTISISDEQRAMIVETIWPTNFMSPIASGAARRLWLFPEEWRNWCSMNVHGLVP